MNKQSLFLARVRNKQKKILVTGVSSGIGRALIKRLVKEGNFTWGIARREELLKNLQKEIGERNKFYYSLMDVSISDNWQKLIDAMKKKKFTPDIIVFNAAINSNDLSGGLNSTATREIFNINFLSIMEGIESLMKFVKPHTQFIAISSLSALKGSGVEGVGYPASKAALSIAFESLHQRYKGQHHFKTVYFGPVASGMGPFKKTWPIILSEDQAVKAIIKAIKSKQAIHYSPTFLFLVLRVMKVLPPSLYFFILSRIEQLHLKLAKRQKL